MSSKQHLSAAPELPDARTAETLDAICPAWCTVKHGERLGEDDLVHVGGALLVRRTVLLLCSSVDPDTGIQDGPIIHLGGEEYTLYEAEALVDALTQLVDRGTQPTALGTGESGPHGNAQSGADATLPATGLARD